MVLLADVVDRGDVRMAEACERKCFFVKAAVSVITGCEHAGGKHLNGDVALEALIAGAVDDTHAAGPKRFQDDVAAHGGAVGKRMTGSSLRMGGHVV